MGRREEHALKQLLRITILLIGLIWILAWAAAGRFDDTPNTQDGSESPLPSGEIAAPGERDSAKTLRVQIQGKVQEMDMGTYLLGVLRAEMPASFEEEALKAQAIAARTYTLYRIRGGGSANHPDADACDDHTCCKAYINAEQAAANWGSMAVYYEEKLARAVSETDGEVILYDGAPILAVFFSSADGSTQGAGDVWPRDGRARTELLLGRNVHGSGIQIPRPRRQAGRRPLRQPRGMDPRYRAKRLGLCRLRHGRRRQAARQ